MIDKLFIVHESIFISVYKDKLNSSHVAIFICIQLILEFPKAISTPDPLFFSTVRTLSTLLLKNTNIFYQAIIPARHSDYRLCLFIPDNICKYVLNWSPKLFSYTQKKWRIISYKQKEKRVAFLNKANCKFFNLCHFYLLSIFFLYFYWRFVHRDLIKNDKYDIYYTNFVTFSWKFQYEPFWCY